MNKIGMSMSNWQKDLLEVSSTSHKAFPQIIRQNSGRRDDYSGVLQISGLSYTYRLNPDNEMEIITATINDTPIVAEKLYTGASVDFILQGQTEKYFGFKPGSTTSTGVVITDMVIHYLTKNPVVDSRLEGRMKRVF